MQIICQYARFPCSSLRPRIRLFEQISKPKILLRPFFLPTDNARPSLPSKHISRIVFTITNIHLIFHIVCSILGFSLLSATSRLMRCGLQGNLSSNPGWLDAVKRPRRSPRSEISFWWRKLPSWSRNFAPRLFSLHNKAELLFCGKLFFNLNFFFHFCFSLSQYLSSRCSLSHRIFKWREKKRRAGWGGALKKTLHDFVFATRARKIFFNESFGFVSWPARSFSILFGLLFSVEKKKNFRNRFFSSFRLRFFREYHAKVLN